MLRKIVSTLLICFSLAIQAETQTSTGADTLILGKPGSGNAVKIKGKDSGYLKKEFNGNWVYSNDGVLEKKIGSGSGTGGSSGVNLLVNDSFEDGISSPWTSSGGTFSQQTFSPVGSEGNLKYGRFVASTSGQYIEQIVSIPQDFSAGCQADFKKVNIATAGLFKIQALDISNNVLAEQAIGVSSWTKVPTISFPCLAPGANNLKLRLISLAAGTIDFDRGYIGSSQNLVNISQNIIAGESYWATTSGCNLIRSTSGTLGAFSTATSCPASTVVDQKLGTWLSVDVDKIQQTINNLPAGEYKATFFLNQSQSVNNGAAFTIFDGTTTCLPSGGNGSAAANAATVVSCIFKYSSAGNRVFEPYAANTSGSVSINNEVPNFVTKFQLERWAGSNETAVSNEQASWFIDANIGGGNPVIGGVTSTYSEITDTNLDLVINTSKGSASALIPCSGVSESHGLSCTVGGTTESVGVAFVPPSSGMYEACFSFSTNSTNGDIPIFQVVETPNNSTSIIQEGGERMQSGFSISAGNSYYTYKLCGSFSFSDVSKRTLRVMYEKSTSNTTNLVGDRSGSAGQRDIKVTVRPLLSAYGRPVLNGDQVTMTGSTKAKIFGIKGTTTSGVLTYNKGGVVTTCTAANPTVCTLVGLTTAPLCVGGPSTGISAYPTDSTSNSLTITSYNSATGALAPSGPFNLICFGE